MKWKVATASVVAAAIVSAPVANAAPSNGNGITGPNNVGQAISQIASIASGGASPAAILNALNTVKGVLDQLKAGKRNHGSGRGAILQQQTQANIGKTLKQKPVDEAAAPDPAPLPATP